MRRLLPLLLAVLLVGPVRAQETSVVVDLIADFVPGPESSAPRIWGELNDQLILLTRGANEELSLWSLAEETPSLIPNIAFENSVHPPRSVGVVNGRLVFAEYLDGSSSQQVYWSTDGTTATRIDTLVDASDSGFPFFSRGTTIGETMYFAASKSSTGSELWATDGLTVWLAADVLPGPASSSPRYAARLGDRLLFGATTPERGNELWALEDGTPYLVRDINPGEADGIDNLLLGLDAFVWDAHLYFAADDDVHGVELWRSDGTTAELVEDIAPGEDSSYPRAFVTADDRLGFLGYTPAFPSSQFGFDALYDYDGQAVRERLNVRTFPYGEDAHLWYETAAWGDTLLVLHQSEYPETSCNAVSLVQWSPVGGAEIVFAGMSGCSTADTGSLTPDGDRFLFRANPSGVGGELGIYDGETVHVQDLVPGPGSSNPHSFTRFEGLTYFIATTPETGYELWALRDASVDADPAASVAEHTGLSLYPNPAHNQLRISFDRALGEPVRLEVIDTTGRRVLRREMQATGPDETLILDVSSWPSGVYWLRISSLRTDTVQAFTVVRRP